MNGTKNWTRFLGLLAFAALTTFLAGSASAQQKTVEQRPAGPHTVQVELTHSTVVLVEGNHLVARLEDGRLEAVMVPDDFRFHMDGRVLSVHELEPGMVLTETVTSTEKPVIVKTVEIHEGTIWNVNGENVYIRLKNTNKVQHLRIPGWAPVKIDGVNQSVFNLHRGMNISATVITEEPVNIVEREARTQVRHPVAEPKEAMQEEPKAKMEEPARETTPPATQAEPEPAQTELPQTASPIPLVGLIGLLSLAASFGLRAARRSL